MVQRHTWVGCALPLVRSGSRPPLHLRRRETLPWIHQIPRAAERLDHAFLDTSRLAADVRVTRRKERTMSTKRSFAAAPVIAGLGPRLRAAAAAVGSLVAVTILFGAAPGGASSSAAQRTTLRVPTTLDG